MKEKSLQQIAGGVAAAAAGMIVTKKANSVRSNTTILLAMQWYVFPY